MTNRLVLKAVIALALGVSFLWGQQIPVAKQPQPKSKKELEAVQAMFQAPDVDARITAAQELITKFADSDFKALALQVMAMSYQQKNDMENMMVYAEKVLEVDPKNFQSMLMLATALAQRTRENDLDKEEKLNQAEKYAKTGLELLKDAPRPNPNMTDEQWQNAKKDVAASAHEALGMVAMVRKKSDVAMSEFKTAIDGASQPDPRTMALLGQLYNNVNKFDEAIAVLDKALAVPDVHRQIKAFAESQRNYAVKMKAATAKPPAPPAPPPAEAKKP